MDGGLADVMYDALRAYFWELLLSFCYQHRLASGHFVLPYCLAKGTARIHRLPLAYDGERCVRGVSNRISAIVISAAS
jgi:hypothetical protein